MPVPYDYPNATDTKDLYSLFSFLTHNTTDGAFMPTMIGVIWVVALINSITEGRGMPRAWIFASFIMSILALVLALIGLLNSQYMYFSFLMVGAGIIWYKLATAPAL